MLHNFQVYLPTFTIRVTYPCRFSKSIPILPASGERWPPGFTQQIEGWRLTKTIQNPVFCGFLILLSFLAILKQPIWSPANPPNKHGKSSPHSMMNLEILDPGKSNAKNGSLKGKFTNIHQPSTNGRWHRIFLHFLGPKKFKNLENCETFDFFSTNCRKMDFWVL